MTAPQGVDRGYRGRDQMNLQEFIADVEKTQFRTPFDTGANPCALMVWNILRNYAGMDRLTRDDLVQNYADIEGLSFEEMKARCDEYEIARRERRLG